MQDILKYIRKNRAMFILVIGVGILVLLNLLIPGRQAAIEETAPPESSAPEADLSLDAQKIRISELMYKNRAVLQDEDGDFSDWIELENCSEEDVSLAGWHLSDREGELGWQLPDIVLPAGGRLVVFASGKDRAETLHTDFALSEGESLYLYNRYDYLAETVSCQGAQANRSLSLDESGEYSPSLYPSPGQPNSAQGYEAFQSGLVSTGPLVINEVMVKNFSTWQGGNLGYCDWVEVKNVSDETLLLSDFYLSDDEDEYRSWQFPQLSLAPGEMIMVCCDESGLSAGEGYVTANFSLGSDGEQLFLSGPQGLIDYVFLQDIPYECSYGRMEGQPGWFYFSTPSPGRANGEGYRRVSAAPQAVTADGVFEDVESVSVELEAAGQIYYTTDGSAPNLDSMRYKGSFSLDSTGIVRAVAVEEGAMPSRELTLSYIINQGHSLPVVSLVAADERQFESMYNNALKGIEIPGSISLYEQDSKFTIACGIKMHGATSLVLPKKNMSLRFRSAYGQESLSYDVFDGGVSKFTNLMLRSGQDFYGAIMRNELSENLAQASSQSLISQRSKYCVLYINGQYSGIYALMEKMNEQHYANIAGVSRESVSVIDANVGVNTDLFRDVFAFCASNDMSLPENYEHFCSLMDVDSLIDWIILESYCVNMDLTSGNLRYCRSTENDGKWRLMFYDLDSTFLQPEQNVYNILSSYYLETRQVSMIIAPLLENDEFVDRLLTRWAELLNSTLTNESVLQEIDRLAAQLEPEVERDYARFGMSLDKWLWNVDYLRSFISDRDWRQHNIDALCEILYLDDQEREAYFGQ